MIAKLHYVTYFSTILDFKKCPPLPDQLTIVGTYSGDAL
jgi:hypothetical protein